MVKISGFLFLNALHFLNFWNKLVDILIINIIKLLRWFLLCSPSECSRNCFGVLPILKKTILLILKSITYVDNILALYLFILSFILIIFHVFHPMVLYYFFKKMLEIWVFLLTWLDTGIQKINWVLKVNKDINFILGLNEPLAKWDNLKQ